MNNRNRLRPISILFNLLAFLGYIMLIVPGVARANTIFVDSPTEFSVQGCSLRQAIVNHNTKGSVCCNSCLFGSDDDVIKITNKITDVFFEFAVAGDFGHLANYF